MKIVDIISGAAMIFLFIVFSILMTIAELSEKWGFRRREKRVALLQKMKR